MNDVIGRPMRITLLTLTSWLSLLGSAAALAEIPTYIMNAPEGQWTAIGINTLQDVQADLSAAPDGFRGNIKGIITAWSSAAYDNARHRLILHGGGHRDYDGNEFYAFDVVSNQWVRLSEPSLYLPTEAVNSVLPDGAPIAVHTYEVLEADPDTGIVYRLFQNSGPTGDASPANKLWGFSQNSGDWVTKELTAAEWPGHRIGGSSAWDPINKVFWMANPDAGNWIRFGRFNPRENQVEEFGVAKTFPQEDNLVSSVRYRGVDGPELVTLNGSKLVSWPVGSDKVSQQTITGAIGFQDGPTPGFTYDERRDIFWIYNESHIGTLYRLDPVSSSTTLVRPGGANPSAPYSGSNGVFGRFRYVADFDILIMVNRADDQVYMYKPEDWQSEPLVRPKSPTLR